VTVNEETEGATETPGRAAVLATVLLLLIYVVVAVAAQAYGGVEPLVKNQEDVLSFLGGEVFGSPLDKILIIAVLTSAAASTQTTILPTARTTLSMARAKALPKSLGHVSTRYLTPTTSTVLMGLFSILWYVGLTIVSEDILFDSIAALGLMIAFYYGLTGYACVLYYRRQLFRNVKTFILAGVLPLLGAVILTWVFIKSCIDLSDPANSESGNSWFGIGPPLIIGIGFLVFGAILMIIWYLAGHREFFRRRTELAAPVAL
jgi:amino acid transporter